MVALRPEPFGALAYHYGNRRLTFLRSPDLVTVVRSLGDHASIDAALAASRIEPSSGRALRARARIARGLRGHPSACANADSLVEDLKHGLDAPICLTWELTYGCNLACIHCLSSSGRRDPNELTTAEAMAVIDELRAMQVFYVNIGGGEPTIRSDFYELVDYAVGSGVGVKFSTNGSTITPQRAARLAGTDYVDVQISIDGATATTNDAVRGDGLVRDRAPGDGPSGGGRVRPVQGQCRRHAAQHGGARRVPVTRRRVRRTAAAHAVAPVGSRRGHVARAASDGGPADRSLPVVAGRIRTPSRATRSSICPRSAIRCRDSTSAAPVASCASSTRSATSTRARSSCIRSSTPAASATRVASLRCGVRSQLFASLREPQAAGACASCGSYDACQGGCMAAKFFTGLPLDGPGSRVRRTATVSSPCWARPRRCLVVPTTRCRSASSRSGEPSRSARSRAAPRPQPHRLRAARDEPGSAPSAVGPPRRVLPASRRGRRRASSSSRRRRSTRSDWPYERSPLAGDAPTGWRADRRRPAMAKARW